MRPERTERSISPLCPTCGCSLVRLGLPRERAATYEYRGEELLFCCDGCVESFKERPAAYLEEIKDWTVCPTCLAEKPKAMTVSVTHNGIEIHFCRCPYCVEEFRKRPEELLTRLAHGATESPKAAG